KACEEIASVAGTRTVSAVGLRGGAALAASTDVRLHRLVLWDPVFSGQTHLESWVTMHREMMLTELGQEWTAPPMESVNELLGFPLAPGLREQLLTLELPRDLAGRCRRGNIVHGANAPVHGLDSEKFRLEAVDFDASWDRYGALHRFLLPTPAIKTIVRLFVENAR
ncbi:MAG: hypothetical protein AAFQ82_26455, partial [Myxococcota bacterium]